MNPALHVFSPRHVALFQHLLSRFIISNAWIGLALPSGRKRVQCLNARSTCNLCPSNDDNRTVRINAFDSKATCDLENFTGTSIVQHLFILSGIYHGACDGHDRHDVYLKWENRQRCFRCLLGLWPLNWLLMYRHSATKPRYRPLISID